MCVFYCYIYILLIWLGCLGATLSIMSPYLSYELWYIGYKIRFSLGSDAYLYEMPGCICTRVQIFFSSNLVRFAIGHLVLPFLSYQAFSAPNSFILRETIPNTWVSPLSPCNSGGFGEAMEAGQGWLERDIPLCPKAIYQPTVRGSKANQAWYLEVGQ